LGGDGAGVPTKPSLPPRVALGRAIRELRHERAWTLEVLADRAGLHWTYIGGVERGTRNPGWENVAKIAIALGVRISELAVRAEKLGL
jgi:transcriptional regulator with XRE-family HTH domain